MGTIRPTNRITRRELLRGAATGAVALALHGDRSALEVSSKPPNIVYMIADDLGYADVSCYGRPALRTPNIDHIAAKGVRFLQAYANSAVCTATRVKLPGSNCTQSVFFAALASSCEGEA